jgi:hypothetical protein
MPADCYTKLILHKHFREYYKLNSHEACCKKHSAIAAVYCLQIHYFIE